MKGQSHNRGKKLPLVRHRLLAVAIYSHKKIVEGKKCSSRDARKFGIAFNVLFCRVDVFLGV